ncbi:MAG: hypothetical protein HKN68_08795 [Saprospiraceae bacterium]|nr:hypothetical protein [Saprospiraceae bacterium]
MTQQFTLQYPAWFILLCLLLGIMLSGMLYYKEQRFRSEHSWLPWLLAFLRALTIAGIAFFLLEPLIRNVKDNIQEPIVVIAQDASESMVSDMDEEGVASLTAKAQALKDQLEIKYDVRSFSFGSDIQEGLVDSFTQKVSNLSNAMDYVEQNYADQNLGALILISDGIYNEGRNPVYNIDHISAPIYTIATGDTSIRTDLTVKGVFANSIVYLGDKFSIQVDVQAFNCNNQNTRLRLYHEKESGRELLEEETLRIDSDNFFTTKEYVVDASTPGTNRYRVTLSPISGEVSRSNNYKDVYIQVLDARQKILLLAQSPHPDISALSQIISNNKNYETEIKFPGDAYNLADYDQVILHNLPGKNSDVTGTLVQIKEKKLPHIFIVGSQMNIGAFNEAQDLITINSNGITLEEVNPAFNNNFKNFNSSEPLRSKLASFPPLIAPFGEYSLVSNAASYLYQNIRSVETDYPLITFQEKSGIRSAVIVGEGLWKWRLFDFLQHGNYEIVSEVINKTIQYISTKKDNRKFILSAAKNLFKENESITINAQLYNDNYELTNEPEVFLSLYDQNGEEFKYTMSRTNDYYTMNVGLLPPGSYRFSGRTNHNGQEHNDNGRFSIQEIQLESFDLQARHDVLTALAGGSDQLYYPENADALASAILEKETIKPVIYQNVKTQPLIDLKWIFFILLAMISVEWGLRRYFGSY